MNRYIAYLDVSIPVYCVAEDEEDAWNKINCHSDTYLRQQFPSDDELLKYVYENCYIEYVEYDSSYEVEEVEEEDREEEVSKEKVIKCAANYLEQKGYDIKKTFFQDYNSFDIVATDCDTNELVFVDVLFDEGSFEPSEFDRAACEEKAYRWFVNHEEEVGCVNFLKWRFDNIHILRVNGDKAMLRHHINIGGIEE